MKNQSHFFLLAGSGLAAQAVAFLALPFIILIFGAQDYGKYALLLSVTALVSSFATLRLENAMVSSENSDIAPLYGASLLSSGLMSGLFSVITLNVSGSLNVDIGQDISFSLIFLLMFTFCFIQIIGTILLRKQHITSISVIRLSQSVFIIAIQLLASIAMRGVSVLVISTVIVNIFFIIIYIIIAKQSISFSLVDMKRVITVNQQFINFSFPSAVLNAFTLNAPIIAAGFYLGSEGVAFVSVCQRISQIPFQAISKAASDALIAKAGKYFRDGEIKKVGIYALSVIKRQLVLAMPLTVGVIIIYVFYNAKLSDEFSQPISFSLLLIPSGILAFVASPLGGLLDIIKRQDIHFIRELFRATIIATGLVIMLAFRHDFLAYIVFLLISGLLSSLTYLISAGSAMRSIGFSEMRASND